MMFPMHSILARLAIIGAVAIAWAQAQPYDLLLRGGRVIDPANNINTPMDVALAGGKIAAVARGIPAANARRVVDVTGLYVTPGLIDIHAHAGVDRPSSGLSYPANMNFSSGLTTIVDAGTWGARDFPEVKRTIIDPAQIRVLSFLNIVAAGMGSEKEQDIREMDVAALRRDHQEISATSSWASRPRITGPACRGTPSIRHGRPSIAPSKPARWPMSR